MEITADTQTTKEAGAKRPASEYVTLVEVLELTRLFEEFAAAIEAAARRLEAEGIRELVTLQFYGDPGSTEVGAILTFADRDRIMESTSAWSRRGKSSSGSSPR